MYACVCDWLGFPYREEVQWVSGPLVLKLFSATCTNDERIGKSIVLDKKKKTKKQTPLQFCKRCTWLCIFNRMLIRFI